LTRGQAAQMIAYIVASSSWKHSARK
jgi:hypothetical protein